MPRALLRLLLVLVVMMMAAPGLMTARAQSGDKVVNVELILDSSGSMAEQLESGQTRIDAAKRC